MPLNEKRINPQEQRKRVYWELAWKVFISSSWGNDVLVDSLRRLPGPQSSLFALKKMSWGHLWAMEAPICSIHNMHGRPWTFASPPYTNCLSTLFIRSEFQMETSSTVFETVWFSLWPIVRKHILLCDPGLTYNILGTEVSELLRCDVISFFLEGNAGPKRYWLHASGHAIPDLEASGPHVIWVIEQGPEMGARWAYTLASWSFLSEWRASLALGWFAGC